MQYDLLKYEELDATLQESVKGFVNSKKKLEDHKATGAEIRTEEKGFKSKIESNLRKKTKSECVVVPYKKMKVKMELIKGKPNPVNKKYISTFLSRRLQGTKIDTKDLVTEMFSATSRGRKEDSYRIYLEDSEEL